MHCEDVPLRKIAQEVGTPCYIYSYQTLNRHFRVFDEPLQNDKRIICYSMKSNSNLAILSLFTKMGGGVDIVSGGELFRALKAGADPRKIVFSGVGKKAHEISEALDANILLFNVESRGELELIEKVARAKDMVASIAIRVNPDIDPKTHPYISTGLKKNKFGIDIHEVEPVFARAHEMKHIEVRGVDYHIGSQITELTPFLSALKKVKELILHLRDTYDMPIEYLDLGGGLGITYDEEKPPHPREYAQEILRHTRELNCTLIFEPGRVLVGNAGILLTEILYIKEKQNKKFVIVDAGMNTLIRPSLYNSYQKIIPVDDLNREIEVVDIVGPICESGDFLALDRQLPRSEYGELLAIMSSGAYGFTMSSQYNSHPRPPEVLVKGNQFSIIRQKENYQDLVKGESLPNFEL